MACEWKYDIKSNSWSCTICGYEYENDDKDIQTIDFNYCPKCGNKIIELILAHQHEEESE